MDPISAFGFEACCTAIAGDLAGALSERSGETAEQQFARARATVHMVMGFLPRDVIEAVLASHCVMFHELMVGSVHNALNAQETKARRAEVLGLIALNKAFCGSLGHLRHYQTRTAEGSREAPKDVPAAPAGGEPLSQSAAEAAAQAPAGTAQGPAPAAPDQMQTMQSSPAAPSGYDPIPGVFSAFHRPPAAATAARQANPAAAAALQAGDPAGFARAMGIEQPSEAFLAAANVAGSPFDPQSLGPWPETAWGCKPKA